MKTKLVEDAFKINIGLYKSNPSNQNATNVLYKLFVPIVFLKLNDTQKLNNFYLRREDLEDISQVVLVRFFVALREKDFSSYQQAATYLKKITISRFIDHVRGKDPAFLQLNEQIIAETPIISIDSDVPADLEYHYELILPFWEKTLRSLTVRESLVMKRLYHVNLRELAAELGEENYSAANFKAKIYRIRQKFKRNLIKI
ncbi:sigma-70 family RNA polymerase sigma factor, partial [candidate division KSB1 bacterium]|nr:sigma-70 family RNA polymerase sigma factor [candidate division KSB1 bacterium]